MNSVKRSCSPWVHVAQWIEHLPDVQEVMGLIPHVGLTHLSHKISFTELDVNHNIRALSLTAITHPNRSVISDSLSIITIYCQQTKHFSVHQVTLHARPPLRPFGSYLSSAARRVLILEIFHLWKLIALFRNYSSLAWFCNQAGLFKSMIKSFVTSKVCDLFSGRLTTTLLTAGNYGNSRCVDNQTPDYTVHGPDSMLAGYFKPLRTQLSTSTTFWLSWMLGLWPLPTYRTINNQHINEK